MVVYGLILNDVVGRLEGVLLLLGVIAYAVWLLRGARKGESPAVEAEYEDVVESAEGSTFSKSLNFQIGLVVVGLALLVRGSQLLVNSAPELFRMAMLIIVPLVMVVCGAAGFQGWRKHRSGKLA